MKAQAKVFHHIRDKLGEVLESFDSMNYPYNNASRFRNSAAKNSAFPAYGPPVAIPIDDLKPADSPRSLGEDEQHIEVLANSAIDLPPIVVHKESMRVIDGMHRLRAAQLLRKKTIEAFLVDGTPEDLFALSVQLNTMHGLPLSLKDRKMAAQRIVQQNPSKSDRSIAEIVGLSPKTISALRKRDSGKPPGDAVRTGRDGRTRPTNPRQRRKQVAELIEANPNRTLRELSQLTGVAPSTVSAIRKDLTSANNVPKSAEASDSPDNSPLSDSASQSTPPAATPGTTAVTTESAALDPRADTLNRVRKDPSLRYTESGRRLLRLFEMQNINESNIQELMAPLPPHIHSLISQLARDFSVKWMRIATRLEEIRVNDPLS